MAGRERIIEVHELEDFDGTLKELRDILNLLIIQYSEFATIKVDAGHNNVSFIVEPVKNFV